MLHQALHDQRELELLRTTGAMSSGNNEEVGNRNAMIREQLLRERLAPRENQSTWIAASVWNTQQLEQAHHVLIEEHVAVKLFEKIEHNVRLELFDRIPNGKKLVLHAERACFMPELAEALHDVEF